MQEHEKPWNPLAVDDVSRLFANAPFPWWIAGGIALELAVGHEIREHSDMDVLVLRRDHAAVRALLSEWDCWAADPPGKLRRWPMGQELGGTVHDIWCRKASDDAWRIQLMLDEADKSDWVSRRDDEIRAPLEGITSATATGIRYLAPHIQLYYKAKNPREKDEADFNAVIASGIRIDTSWLRSSIARSYGVQHPWLERLPR